MFLATVTGNDRVEAGIRPVRIGDDLHIKCGIGEESSLLTLSHSLKEAIQQLNAECGIDQLPRIAEGTITAGLKLSMETHKMEQRNHALVLIELETKDQDGVMSYSASKGCEEEIVNGRVQYTYHDFPSVGIEVLGYGMGPYEEPHCLIEMMPNSSFKIFRTGTGFGDASPEWDIRWTGRALIMGPPARYKRYGVSITSVATRPGDQQLNRGQYKKAS